MSLCCVGLAVFTSILSETFRFDMTEENTLFRNPVDKVISVTFLDKLVKIHQNGEKNTHA